MNINCKVQRVKPISHLFTQLQVSVRENRVCVMHWKVAAVT